MFFHNSTLFKQIWTFASKLHCLVFAFSFTTTSFSGIIVTSKFCSFWNAASAFYFNAFDQSTLTVLLTPSLATIFLPSFSVLCPTLSSTAKSPIKLFSKKSTCCSGSLTFPTNIFVVLNTFFKQSNANVFTEDRKQSMFSFYLE